MVEVFAMYALLARGGSGWMSRSSGFKLLGMSAMIPLGYSLDRVYGTLMGFVLADVAKH